MKRTSLKAVVGAFKYRNTSLPVLVQLLNGEQSKKIDPVVQSPPISTVRLARRLFGGFAGPLREDAVIALSLRRAGYPAELVLGYDPLPTADLEYRLLSWVEIDGVPTGTALPAHTYLPELLRFPGITC